MAWRASNLASTGKTVHIKLFPSPRTFPERREVLKVLERFGEVAVFKSLKYEARQVVNNAFRAVFTTEKAAQDCIIASPIRYQLITETEGPEPTDPLASSPSTDETSNPPAETSPASYPAVKLFRKKEETAFELTASTTTFDHSQYIQSPITGPLYGPYPPITPKHSYIGSVLEKSIPRNTLWGLGLMDWETRTRGLRNRDWGDLGVTAKDGTEMNSAFWVAQKERTIKEKNLPRVMSGLKALIEEHEAEKKNAATGFLVVGNAENASER